MTADYLFELDPHTHARTSDPRTSHAAAHRLAHRETMLRRLLVEFERYPAGLTAEESSTFAGYTADDGAWKRVSDLALRGWIEDTGRNRIASSGREQIVRRITAAGRKALHP